MQLIIALIVLLVVIVIAKYILDELELKPNHRKVAMLIIALFAFLVLAQMLFGVVPGWGWPRRFCP